MPQPLYRPSLYAPARAGASPPFAAEVVACASVANSRGAPGTTAALCVDGCAGAWVGAGGAGSDDTGGDATTAATFVAGAGFAVDPPIGAATVLGAGAAVLGATAGALATGAVATGDGAVGGAAALLATVAGFDVGADGTVAGGAAEASGVLATGVPPTSPTVAAANGLWGGSRRSVCSSSRSAAAFVRAQPAA